MNSTLAVVLFVLAISISECAGHFCLKKFHLDERKMHFYYLAIGFYIVVSALIVLSHKHNGLGIINVMWSGLSVMLIAVIGALFFNISLTPLHKFGMLLIVAGIACVLNEN